MQYLYAYTEGMARNRVTYKDDKRLTSRGGHVRIGWKLGGFSMDEAARNDYRVTVNTTGGGWGERIGGKRNIFNYIFSPIPQKGLLLPFIASTSVTL